MSFSVGYPKEARTFSGVAFSLVSAERVNSASWVSFFTDALPRLSCFTSFQTYSSGFRPGK